MKVEKKAAITVVLYARASTDEQTASCGDQIKALRKEADARGYSIIKEYVDDGLSGSREIEKRVAFHTLIADSYKRDFTRVMVYDTSRFGRMDSQKAAEYKIKLRQNGVTSLESLAEGIIDWSTQMGRLQDALMSEANYEAALKISRSSIRGRMSRLEQKLFPHSTVPYGYDRIYRGDNQEIRVARGERFRQPRTWTRQLVVNDTESAVVRDIYDMYVNKAQSMRQIAIALTRRGIKGWNDRGWSWDSVRKIITSKAYLGYAVITGSKSRERHNRMTPQEVPNVLPPILTGAEGEELWHAAQRLHKAAAVSRFRSDKGNRTLGGILRCGHCGYALVSRQRKHESGSQGPVFYACIGGLKRATGCPQWRAYESEVLPVIVKELVKVVDAEVLASIAPKEDEADDPSRALRSEVAKMREQVKRATLRAAVADDDMLAEYDQVARELKAELIKAEDRLALHRHVEREGGAAIWTEWWAEVRPGLVLAAGDEDLVAELHDARKRHPALGKVRGNGGIDAFMAAARQGLVRVASDGQTDPMLAILPELLEGDSEGTLLDSSTLRGVLRKVGCEVSLYWTRNEKKTKRTENQWLLDKAKIEINWVGHAAPSGTAGGRSRRSSPTAAPATGTRPPGSCTRP